MTGSYPKIAARERLDRHVVLNMADGPNSAETYKEIQERFVSNLNGTTILEVGVVASTAPVAAVFRSFIFSALFFNRKGHLSKWVFLW